MSLKLYKVTCKGMTTNTTGVAHGAAYVLAADPTTAYETMRADLDKRDLGFSNGRELDRVELIAENVSYPDCGTRVYTSLSTTPSGAVSEREEEMEHLLHDLYSRLWTEASYDAENPATRKFAKPLAEMLMKANETLKFKQ